MANINDRRNREYKRIQICTALQWQDFSLKLANLPPLSTAPPPTSASAFRVTRGRPGYPLIDLGNERLMSGTDHERGCS